MHVRTVAKKIVSMLCVVALVVACVGYEKPKVALGLDYDSLTYTSLGYDISYSYVSNTLAGLGNPELLDDGSTLQFAFSADNTNVTVTINGSVVTTSSSMVTEILNSLVKLNPMEFDDDSYTDVVISASTGSAEIVIKKGNPTSGGSGSGSVETTNESTTASQGRQDTTTAVPTGDVPSQVQGVVAQTEVGESHIDNSVMIAWASSTDNPEAAGYDPSVTSYDVYIYQGNELVTRIVGATNGGVIGGLSAGSYSTAVAAVNSSGEGVLSDKVSFTVTGITLNFTYEKECDGPKMPAGLSIITAGETGPSVGNETNAIELAWAASSNAQSISYDPSVVGYNVYIFDMDTGNQYRRVHVEGIDTTYVAIKSVSKGTYLVYLTALDADGEESAMSAPAISLASSVTVTGDVLDNAESFDYPDQPLLPEGLVVSTDGIQYGFNVAWSAAADLTGIRLNLFVDGVCIKAGINEDGTPSYYEHRLAAGTYTVEVTAQYISNNVESFPFTATVTIAADPGLDTKTPKELEDTSYVPYVYEEPTEEETLEETTTLGDDNTGESIGDGTTAGQSDETTKSGDVESSNGAQVTDESNEDAKINPGASSDASGSNEVSGTSNVQSASGIANSSNAKDSDKAITVGSTKVKKAIKKKSAKKAKIKVKKVSGATGYEIEVSREKSFKKNIILKDSKKIKIKVKGLKPGKKYYVRVRAYINSNGAVYYGKWTKAKKIKMKK